MSWTPANSIGTRAAHPSRMRILSEYRESTDPSRSYREGSHLAGKDPSPGSVRLFTCRSTPLSPIFSTLAHRLRAERGDARAHSRKWKWANSAQFWCNLSLLDATLLRPVLCVANKELVEYLSPLYATLTKNIGGGGVLLLTRIPKTVQFGHPNRTHIRPSARDFFSTGHGTRITDHESRLTRHSREAPNWA
jgi:hypothetical protein